MIALLIAAAAVAVFVFFALRPALLLGSKPGALADSLAGELDERNGRRTVDDPDPLSHACADSGAVETEFECSIETIPDGDVGSGSTPEVTRYAVDVDLLGCWHASKLEGSARGAVSADGCIGLLDY